MDKQQIKKHLQNYLFDNDKLFENAKEEDRPKPQAIIAAISLKALWTRKQAAKFMEQALDFPIENERMSYNSTGNFPPGLEIKSRGWIYHANDGYFYICCGKNTLYFTDRRFY